jgi:hypothetical protein
MAKAAVEQVAATSARPAYFFIQRLPDIRNPCYIYSHSREQFAMSLEPHNPLESFGPEAARRRNFLFGFAVTH